MNNRQLAKITCFDKIAAFGTVKGSVLADDVTDTAARKKAKAKARGKFTELNTLTAAIRQEIAKEQSGGKAISTSNRAAFRLALVNDLREWNRTAVAIAEDLKRPEIMDGFRSPQGNNDTELAGRARAFIQSVADLELHDAFVENGLEEDFETVLSQRVAAFEASQSVQSAAGQEVSGAVDTLDQLVKTGMSLRKTLDVLVRNLYKTNTAVISEWDSATHIERIAIRKIKPASAPVS